MLIGRGRSGRIKRIIIIKKERKKKKRTRIITRSSLLPGLPTAVPRYTRRWELSADRRFFDVLIRNPSSRYERAHARTHARHPAAHDDDDNIITRCTTRRTGNRGAVSRPFWIRVRARRRCPPSLFAAARDANSRRRRGARLPIRESRKEIYILFLQICIPTNVNILSGIHVYILLLFYSRRGYGE